MKTKKKQPLLAKRIRLVLVAVILAGASVYAAYLFYEHKQEQRQLQQTLGQAGEELDTFKDDLQKAGFEDIERIERCYRAARKFESEPIYCEQRLRVRARGLPDKSIIDQASAFEKTLFEQDLFSFKNFDKEEIAFVKGIISKNYTLTIKNTGNYCWAHLSAINNSQERTEEFRGTYGVDIACTEGAFDSFIYPELELEH